MGGIVPALALKVMDGEEGEGQKAGKRGGKKPKESLRMKHWV